MGAVREIAVQLSASRFILALLETCLQGPPKDHAIVCVCWGGAIKETVENFKTLKFYWKILLLNSSKVNLQKSFRACLLTLQYIGNENSNSVKLLQSKTPNEKVISMGEEDYYFSGEDTYW